MNNKDSVPKTNSEKQNKTPEECNLNSLTPLQRFEDSMQIGFEEWHDGIGYDIEAIRLASQAEREAIEQILINHSPRDWRDIEALAEINTKCARETIKEAIKDPNPVVRVAVTRFAPDLVTDIERSKSITDALQNIEIFSGLSQVLLEVERHHPKEVIEALIKGLLNRKGDVAVHFVAMLFYLFEEAKEPFDWKQRPFFLRFNTEDRKERVELFREVCQKLKINPEKYLPRKQESINVNGIKSCNCNKNCKLSRK
jgi:hypothetical protein